MVLASAVASGVITAVQAWPEYFDLPEGDTGAFPSKDADMSGFELERATPESVLADMAALVQASQQITIREEDPPPFPVFPAEPDPEWP
jgi:hypothetical protein